MIEEINCYAQALKLIHLVREQVYFKSTCRTCCQNGTKDEILYAYSRQVKHFECRINSCLQSGFIIFFAPISHLFLNSVINKYMRTNRDSVDFFTINTQREGEDQTNYLNIYKL